MGASVEVQIVSASSIMAVSRSIGAKNGASRPKRAALASGLTQMDAPPQTAGSNCPATINTGTRIAKLAPEISTEPAVLSSAVVTVSLWPRRAL